MPLINCPDCNKEVSDLAAACPNCARPLRAPAPVSNATALRVARLAEAQKYNYTSWFVFVTSILLFFVGLWGPAIILFIGAFVLAIIYHVKR
jgi:hypothetical protein